MKIGWEMAELTLSGIWTFVSYTRNTIMAWEAAFQTQPPKYTRARSMKHTLINTYVL